MRRVIVVLEDNTDRIAVMDDCLADKFPFFERRFFRTALAAIEWLREHLMNSACISLDHDLEPTSASDADPGTGRMVADFLSGYFPTCPIVLHTTNRIAADGMEFVLADRGWIVERIVPYENCRWISEAWLPIVRQVIVNAGGTEQRPVIVKPRS